MEGYLKLRFGWIERAVQELGSPENILSNEIPIPANMKAHQARAHFCEGMAACGYEIDKNPKTKDGRWKVGRKNLTRYSKKAGQSTP